MNNNIPHICIVGGGLTGLTTALALSQKKMHITHVAPAQSIPDMRTTALLMHSVDLFKQYGIWDKILAKAFPLKTMRIVDGTNRLIRTQQADFHASEIDLEAFGYNVKNQDVLDILKDKIFEKKNIKQIETVVADIKQNDTSYTIKPEKGRAFKCDILIGADGRNSIVSKLMEGKPKRWDYPQSAIVLDFEHIISNQYVSTEFHRENGPFTIVPHSLNKAGLVWMENPAEVERLLKLKPEALELQIEQNMQSFLGKIKITSKVQSFPISGMVAKTFGDARHILLGEAAHVFPPIGAQGFNLGIRDLETFIEILEQNSQAPNIGHQYHQARIKDVNIRTSGVDMLNRSLLSGFIPVQFLRAFGLFALTKISPLRKLVMKFGIAP